MICKLALEDGSVFTGTAFGATGTHTGEVVFNTAMTGYQEIFTDPSYCGQIVVMTFPLIGNYGVNEEDFESDQPHLSGFVVKELPRRPSNHRATASFEAFLAERGVLGIADIDTRALTRRIRVHGAVRGVISNEITSDLELVEMARASDSMVGANLVTRVAPADVRTWNQPLPVEATPGTAKRSATHCHIVAIDCGIKYNILRHLADGGDRVTVVPGSAGAAAIRDLAPDGILVGNGPGDPAAVTDTIQTLRDLLGEFPMMGICLGHQMMSLALGAETYKLKFGHHGGNVPVLNQPANRVEITSQNHGFAVDAKSLEAHGGTVTHVNLNDQSLEGFAHPDKQAAAIQFHPEASPGPHDAEHVFAGFLDVVRNGKPLTAETVFASKAAK
jgi:carbamoyl-phosphate synthase small subunit